MHGEYENMLFDKKQMRPKIKGRQCKSQQLKFKFNEIVLSCFDDKQYILDDGIKTLSYWHKDIIWLIWLLLDWLIEPDIFIRHKRYMENVVKSDILMKSDLFDR